MPDKPKGGQKVFVTVASVLGVVKILSDENELLKFLKIINFRK